MTVSVPDFNIYRTDKALMDAANENNRIRLSWNDKSENLVHLIWLRENCPCNQCRDGEVRERTILLEDIAEDISAISLNITDSGNLEVLWSDDHPSTYHRGWLFESLNEPDASIVQETWDASLANHLPLINGSKIKDELDPAFAEWIEAICRYGVGILTNTPAEPETVKRLALLIGPIRPSNFGYLFDVVTRSGSDSLAFTSDELKPHTDLATREYQPGLQFLHCLKNDAEGGESVLVDGYRIAEIIRDRHPEEYETLTRVPLDFQNAAQTSDYRWSVPVINLNNDGSFHEIRMTYWLRAPQRATPEMHDRIYTALRLFMRLADAPENKIIYKLRPGDLLAFDNRRFLHGRLAFNMDSGERWLQGCYGEREELLSRNRIIKRNKKQV